MERRTLRQDRCRLSVFELALPPLGERPGDILLLAEAFLKDVAASVAAGPPQVWAGVSLEGIERDLVRAGTSHSSQQQVAGRANLGLPRGQFYSLLRRDGLTDARR